MKIRMKDNFLRLRLMQDEVEKFHNEGFLKSTTCLGSSLENCLSYSLVKSEAAVAVTAIFEDREIKVSVPEKLAIDWALTEVVGFEEQMPLASGNYLHILVEKDFRCLEVRPHEERFGHTC